MEPQLRELRLTVPKGATLRNGTFDNREHIIVPVVMLREGVVFGMGAPGPEFVSFEVLAKCPTEWNGRPVVADHPVRGGLPMSANERKVLEDEAFGLIQDARADDQSRSLLADAWIDPKRIKAGSSGERILERLQAGATIEVSVGSFVMVEQQSGNWDGFDYVGIWTEVHSDHLALLSEGQTGACSNEMGCGAPRTFNKETEMAAENPLDKIRGQVRKFFDRVLTFRPSQEESVTDRELRAALEAALFAIEPGFLGVDSVDLTKSKVIYAVMPEQAVQLFWRSYSLGADNAVTLADDREEVREVRRFEPLTANQPAPPASPCGCGGSTQLAAAAAESEGNMTKKERVDALIASKKFGEADRASLEAMSDEGLNAIEAVSVAAEQRGDPVAPPAAPLTEEQKEAAFLASAPQSIRDLIARQKAQDETRRVNLVASLKTCQKAYTEAELNAMPVGQLEKLAAIAIPEVPATDYSIRAAAHVSNIETGDESDVYRNPPDPYKAALEKRAAAQRH